ncbi:MAG: ABC transporter ATP-binding protein [Acidimicrobiales bacterium]|nr:ABC transporter ATP-binding protein [Acidimicrobiales bacterium]MCB9372186.1 ABC transporter ATP-binding protein [Microthrixaceae bacterium]
MSLLRAEEVSKRFSGLSALDAVSLTVAPGEIVGLIGPNGAGKTTLFNCLYGVLAPDGGRITFDGRDLAGLAVHRRARLGIGRTFQRIELFAGMTVRDHLLVAERARRGDGALWKDLCNRSRPTSDERARADATLGLLGLDDVADRPVESLSLGRGRLVELGRALMIEPRLLLLDEPSSGLDHRETDEMADVLDVVRRERGTAILLVEHDVAMVRRVTSRLYVLDFGQLIADGPTAEVVADARVRQAYLGDTV